VPRTPPPSLPPPPPPPRHHPRHLPTDRPAARECGRAVALRRLPRVRTHVRSVLSSLMTIVFQNRALSWVFILGSAVVVWGVEWSRFDCSAEKKMSGNIIREARATARPSICFGREIILSVSPRVLFISGSM
jgi:hypothetical protein